MLTIVFNQNESYQINALNLGIVSSIKEKSARTGSGFNHRFFLNY